MASILTQDQMETIHIRLSQFKHKVSEYNWKKRQLDELHKHIANTIMELSEVAKEERQLESAIAILYGSTKGQSRTIELEKSIAVGQEQVKVIQNDLNKLRVELLAILQILPIPADLGKFGSDSGHYFSYIEGSKLGESALLVISDLLRKKSPVQFNDITILPDKILITNPSDKQDALNKLVEGIKGFRCAVDEAVSVYGNIDVLVDRLTSSTLYADILLALSEKKELSIQDLANTLNVDERKVYDSCYNLTRSNWSPVPIQKTAAGDWELTLAGKILVTRLLEKSPQSNISG